MNHRTTALAVMGTLLVLFLTAWFYLTNLNIEKIDVDPVASPSATLAPVREVNSGSQPVINAPILRPTPTVGHNNPQNYQPSNNVNIEQPKEQPEPTQRPVLEVPPVEKILDRLL